MKNKVKWDAKGEIASRKLEQYGEAHTIVCDTLLKRETELKQKVVTLCEEYFSNLHGDSPLEKFCQALADETFWLCDSYLRRKWSHSIVFKHYGYFIHALLKHNVMKGLCVANGDTFINLFQSTFNSVKSAHPFADALAEYFHFLDDFDVPYSYDESFVPVLDDDKVYICQRPIDYYHIILNQSRANILLAFLKLKSIPLMDKALATMKNSNMVESLEMDDEDYSLLLANFASKHLLDAMQLSTFPFKVGDRLMDYTKLFFPLKDFIVKQKAGYAKLMNCLPKEYNMGMFQKQIPETPFSHIFVLDQERYCNEAERKREEWAEFEYFRKAFSYSKNESTYPDIKPFICIDNIIFCPTILLAQYDIIYGFLQLFNMNVTEQKAMQRQRSLKLEEQLYKCLSKGCWETIPLYEESPENGGDADIVLQDEENVVLIQIKKQNFRTDLKRTVVDQIQLDEHAAEQLNKFEQSNPEMCQGKNITKWVASSFDGCRNDINGCRKVSYLDLLLWFPLRKYQNLSQFIKDVHTDKPLQDIIGIIKERKSGFLSKELGRALPIVNPNSYRTRIDCFETKNDNEKIDELFWEFETAKPDKRKTILIEMKKLSEKYPNDYMIWHYLGVRLWENGEYEDAEKALVKTLTILPYEPLTMRMLSKMYAQWAHDEPSNKRKFFDKMGIINAQFRDIYWFIDENNFVPYKLPLYPSFNQNY